MTHLYYWISDENIRPIPFGMLKSIVGYYRIVSEGIILFENFDGLSDAFIVVPEILSAEAAIQIDQATIAVRVSSDFFESMVDDEGAAVFTTVLQRSAKLPNVWLLAVNVSCNELRLLLDLADSYVVRCLREGSDTGYVSLLLFTSEPACKHIQLEIEKKVVDDLMRLSIIGLGICDRTRVAEQVCLASMVGNREVFPMSIPGLIPEHVTTLPVLSPASATVFRGLVDEVATVVKPELQDCPGAI